MPLYFLLMLYIVLVPFGLCQSPQYLYIKEVKIHKLKQNGKHWDSFKGNPDVQCNIYTLQNGIWKKTFSSSSYNNTLHIEDEIACEIEVYPDFQIKIEVVDLDLGDHDTIGKLNVTIHKDDFIENTCEISFDRVEKFVYFFSPHRTVNEKKFAEKVNAEANKRLNEYKELVAKEITQYKKTITKMEKTLQEKEKRINEYTKIIEHLTEKMRTLKKETEDEAWDKFEDDLKDDHQAHTKIFCVLPILCAIIHKNKSNGFLIEGIEVAQIIVMDGPGSGTTYELEAVNNIGRGDNCNIKLQSANIGPLQAIIKKKASHYNIIGATAGSVLVNGQPIHKERKLIHGDMITLADIMLLYGEEPAGGDSPLVGGAPHQQNADEPMITNTQTYYKDTNTALANLDDGTQKASQNIKVLLKVSNAIMSKLEPKELLSQLLDIMFDEIPSVDRGMVLLKESDASSKLWPMASKKRPNVTKDVVPSRTIIKRVLQTKEGVLTEDAKGDYGDMAVSIVNQSIEAAICVPLVGKNNNILGIIHLDSTRQNQTFREDHLRLVTAIAMQASLAMENAILVKHLGEKQRMQRELDIANDIQMKLLPKNLPVTEGLEVYGLMKPAKEVGGDYYDFLIPENSNNRKLFICIGDVSGKGVPAGLVMVMARCFFRPLIISCKNTKMIIEEMNKFLVEDTRKDMFMSMLVLSWDADKEQIQWTGAGHEHIIVYRAQTKKCETIRAGGIVLGMMKKANRFFKDQYLALQPGDAIILYTDGVTEAINPAKKMFELENLVTLCEKYGHLPSEQICKRLLEDLKRFMANAPQHDDITLVAIKKK